MIEEIDIDSWEQVDPTDANFIVMRFPDLDTINRPVSNPVDLSMALEIVGQWLYSHDYGAIATKRNEDNSAWLAKCKPVF